LKEILNIDGVFEGGGIKGIAFVGAVCCLEEKGYKFSRLAGTSAGAIIASLLAVGYTGEELKTIMLNLDYSKLIDKRGLNRIPVLGNEIALIKHKGIYEGNYIESWLASLFEQKKKTKFKDIMNNGRSNLKIIASDITKKEILILPDDLIRYDINPMEFEIWKAVRMSISIPLFFRPIKFQHNKSESFIVDGGLLSNFPVWIFDVSGIPRWPTFGFNLVNIKKSTKKEINFINYISDLIDTIINRNEDVYVRDKDSVRIINIPALGVGATQFNISKEMSTKLFQSGYESTKTFINTWDFEEYIKKYRTMNRI
jgi:NTE family protein